MSYHGFNQAYISLRIEKYIFLYTCIHIHWAGHLVYHTPLQNLVATRQRLSTGAPVMIGSYGVTICSSISLTITIDMVVHGVCC